MKNNSSDKITVTFDTKTVVRVIAIAAITFVGFAFISKISFALQLIFVSAFLAIALNPAVSWIKKQLPNKSRVTATAVAYSIVITVLLSFFIVIVPPFVNQLADLFNEIPLDIQDFQNQDTAIVNFIESNNLTDQYTEIIGEVKNNLKNITGRAITTATTVGSGIIAFVTVLVMTFMMLIEGPRWVQRLVALQPKSKVEKRISVMKDMYRMVTGYVNGQLLIASIAASFAFFALIIASTVFNVTVNPVALAAIVGLIGLIPMIGNTIAAIIVVIFCLFVSLPLAITMAIFFLLYQQIENATLQPYIQAKYNELTPLTVFIAAIIGVSVAGFIGALVAIPVAGCMRIFVKAYYGDKLAPRNTEKISI